ASVVEDGKPTPVWTGSTDEAGGFGFELHPADFKPDSAVAITVTRGAEPLAQHEVPLPAIADRGTHVDLVVGAKQSGHASAAASAMPVLPFPIGFPGGGRPPGQQGPLPIQLPRPANVPAHPMAALPFLIHASFPNDPEDHARPATPPVPPIRLPAGPEPP
ncbi:MAG TPA: hypothetical protein VHT91_10300, partial [Kofleriaceae bacterium]|nr:hypothetical protein [Kofleriaceae bacterium]